MYRLRRHWSACAWIACLAVLFNAFTPILSHAFNAPVRATVEMELCTALGMKMMPMALPDPSRKQTSDEPRKATAHCGYCTMYAGPLDMPPSSSRVFAVSEIRDAYPPLYYQASRPLFPWSLAQSRAPPVSA